MEVVTFFSCRSSAKLGSSVWIGWQEPLVTKRQTSPENTHNDSRRGENSEETQNKSPLESLNHGAGGLLEAVVVVLLPISSGDGPLHVGALGEDSVQYPFLC